VGKQSPGNRLRSLLGGDSDLWRTGVDLAATIPRPHHGLFAGVPRPPTPVNIGAYLGNSGLLIPEGSNESSPAIYCWDSVPKTRPSRQGRSSFVASRQMGRHAISRSSLPGRIVLSDINPAISCWATFSYPSGTIRRAFITFSVQALMCAVRGTLPPI
jgi:hypothetical protein